MNKAHLIIAVAAITLAGASASAQDASKLFTASSGFIPFQVNWTNRCLAIAQNGMKGSAQDAVDANVELWYEDMMALHKLDKVAFPYVPYPLKGWNYPAPASKIPSFPLPYGFLTPYGLQPFDPNKKP